MAAGGSRGSPIEVVRRLAARTPPAMVHVVHGSSMVHVFHARRRSVNTSRHFFLVFHARRRRVTLLAMVLVFHARIPAYANSAMVHVFHGRLHGSRVSCE